ncbi:MAG TPA: TIGR03619 family F420-dependent LLM class oxidoreductase [Candidatus Binataceae bacterium]|nr:TIGR03619 family F420-dependent LLM class oxidoreductase [Stellaceae bacterium]HVC45087.1 TIGR03619 family F420-dependent LLM class oxidoreductase [Candidatus Binataceae bacterium]
MKIGLLAVVNEHSVGPANLARKAEALGFESLWLPDHPVMPVHTTTPLPETPPGKGEIPDHYSHMCDPFIAMSMAAAATTNLMVATGVCLVPERSPIITANEVATLDAFSKGRVLFGIGAGWLKEESEMLGADFPHRWTQTKEYIAAMRELWTKEEASFAGKYVNFPPVRCYPKPARKGGPPVLIGSKDKNALRWVAQWGDGWCPILYSPAEMKTHLGKLREECTKAGTSYDRLDLTIMRALRGDRAEVQEGLRQYAELGIHRFVVMMIANRLNDDNYAAELERIASLYI